MSWYVDKLLILAGPYSGKTTLAKTGRAVDVELNKESEFAETSLAYKKAREAGAGESELKKLDDARRRAYDDDFQRALESDASVVVGHFSPDKYKAGKAAGRDVRIVVLHPDVLRMRMRKSKDSPDLQISRNAAAAEQLANLVDWLHTDGKWEDPRIYSDMEAALGPAM
jgi:hypothetical protein